MVAKIGLNFNWDKSRKSDNLKLTETDLRSTVHYLSSRENKAWKNLGLYGISREVMNYFTGFFGTNIVINSLVEHFTSIAKVIGSIRVQA